MRRSITLLRCALCIGLLWAARGATAETAGRAEIIRSEAERIRGRVEALGGWQAWDDSLAEWRKAIGALALEGQGRRGIEGMLFHGATVGFLQRSLQPAESGGGAVPAWETSAVTAARDLSVQLAARGIDLIVVPVPSTLSIYPERSGTPPPTEVGVQYLRLVSELLANDVEVIDLYTPFLQHRFDGEELLYYATDHHWNGRGIALGASIIAERLSRYSMIADAKSRPPMYVLKEVPIRQWRGGLALGADARQFPPEDIERFQVSNLDGTVYREPAEAPIVVVGDSFVMYHRFERSATDLGPNLAYKLNCPVQTLMNNGIVARQVPRRIARQGPAFLNARIALVWVALDISFQEDQLRLKGVVHP